MLTAYICVEVPTMTHRRVTLTLEENVLATAKKNAGLIPLSRWIESLIQKESVRGKNS